MNCHLFIARRFLSSCLLTAVCASGVVFAEGGVDVTPVQDEGIDADAPATYRLPLIGLCDPADEGAVTGKVAGPMKEGFTKPQVADEPVSAGALLVPATSNGLAKQLLPATQRGYHLAQRGAFFAARTEFIQVLRRVAQAKDTSVGTDEHSRQLAAGLRAMDEADDFVPQGAQLEAELDVRKVASAHRTP